MIVSMLLFIWTVFNVNKILLAANPESKSSALSLIDYLKKQDESFHVASQKDVVLVLGITGSGKSTLTSILSDAELESIAINKGDGTYRIEDKNDKISGISTTISKTILPNLMVNERNGIAFYDCPGFVDSRGVNEELTVTFGIHKLLNYAGSLKFLFAVPHSSLQVAIGDRLGFLELVQYAVQMIKDIEKYRDAIAMVVTKVPNTYINKDGQLKLVDDSTKIQAIANFLRQTRIDLMNKTPRVLTENWRKNTDQQIKFIDILLEKNTENGYTRIGIMRLTSEPGLLSKMPLIQNEKNAILKIVNENLRFVHKEDDDFGYVISDKSKLQLNDLKDELNKGLIDNFNAINSEIRQSLLQKEIECSNSLNDSFTTFSAINQILTEITSGEPKIFANQLMNVADTLGINTSTQQFKNFLKYIEIMNIVQLFNTNKITLPEEIRNQVTDLKSYANNAQSWYNFLVHLYEKLSEHTAQHLQEYNGNTGLNLLIGDVNDEKTVSSLNLKAAMDSVDPKIYDQIMDLRVNKYKLKLLQIVWNQFMQRVSIDCSTDGEKLVAKGYNVLISNVIQSECWPSATNIKVFALNKVFIDADIDKPSTYLSIISPEWEVVEEESTRQIKLNGVNAIEHSNSQHDVVKPGTPGTPGGAGGQFFGIGLTINDKRLEINVSGGNGTDGHDGIEGVNGNNGLELVKSLDLDYLRRSGTQCGSKREETPMVVKRTRQFCGKPGTPGTDGTDGGCKGFGGSHGESQIIGLQNQPNIAVIKENGVSGKDGKGGLGGIGGKNGRILNVMVVMPTFVNIIAFPIVHNGRFMVTEKWYEDSDPQPNGKNGTDGGICLETGPKTFNFYDSHQTLNEYKQYGNEYLANNIKVPSLNYFLKYLGTITDSITKIWKR